MWKQLFNPFTRKKKKWDSQYAEGKWDGLRSELEEERFKVVRDFICKYSDRGHILEIGCGEGLLQERLHADAYSKFVGVDLSEVAIKKTTHLQNDAVQYLCADMEQFVPSEKYDIIVFNESLYYSLRPVRLLKKYLASLKKKGVIIVSIYHGRRNLKVLQQIRRHFKPLESTKTVNERGSWYCDVYVFD